MKFWGVYELLIGGLFAVDSSLGMVPGVSGSLPNWWGPVTLASAILLALEGLKRLVPKAHPGVFIGLAAAVPIGFWGIFGGWSVQLWMFSVALAFLQWTLGRLTSATGRAELGAFLLAAVLAFALLNTTVALFRFYWESPWMWPLGKILGFMFPIALPWTLIVLLLLHAAGSVLQKKSPQGEVEVPHRV